MRGKLIMLILVSRQAGRGGWQIHETCLRGQLIGGIRTQCPRLAGIDGPGAITYRGERRH